MHRIRITAAAAIASAVAVIATFAVVDPGLTPAGAAPTITRIDLGGAADAAMLAPDGAGKVWYDRPGTTGYGYVSGGTANALTFDFPTTGYLAVLSGTPYFWVDLGGLGGPEWDQFTGSTGDVEANASIWSPVVAPLDVVASTSAGVWSSVADGSFGAVIGTNGVCPGSTQCRTDFDGSVGSLTLDGSGDLWITSTTGATLRRLTPGNSSALAMTSFTLGNQVGRIASAGSSIYAAVPGQSVLRRITPGTAPAVTETDFAVSGPIGDVEADVDGNIWFSIAGSSTMGVLSSGTVHEFATPAPAVRLAYDASDDQLWWSESGTAKVAHMTATVADVLPTTTTTSTTTTTTTTTSTTTTTTTTAPPTTTAPTTTVPETTTTTTPADTTPGTAPLFGNRARRDGSGRVRLGFGPASEPLVLFAQLRINGVAVGVAGRLLGAGGVGELSFTVPRKYRSRKTVNATVVWATIDASKNAQLFSRDITLTK